MPKVDPKRILRWVLPVCVAFAAFGLSRMDVAELMELRLLDARFRLRGPHPVEASPIQLVTIDDQTFQALPWKWPFDGSHYARLIENLNRAGARWIVLDVEFAESGGADFRGDALFAAAIREAGNVILAGKIAYSSSSQARSGYTFAVPPNALLRETGAPWGLVNEITDADNTVRRALLYLPYEETLKPSLIVEILKNDRESAASSIQPDDRIFRIGDVEIPRYDRNSFLINYYGPAGTFPAISFASVLDDAAFDLGPNYDTNYLDRILSSDIKNPFADKIVLVGASAAELHDLKRTPFDGRSGRNELMSGVEVYAHALQTCWDGSFVRRISPLTVLLLSLVISSLVFAALGLLKPLRGSLVSLLLPAALVSGAFVLFQQVHLWIDLVAPLLAAALSVLAASVYFYFLEKSEKAQIRRMFNHYVPDDLIHELLKNPGLLKLGGERRRLTILFADIEDFTSVSEKMIPVNMVALLNQYMTAMTEVIQAEGGMIDKYEGDLIMAEFGAPLPCPDHPLRACRAALRMQAALDHLHRKWQAQGKPALRLRIGINSGDVIVGNMGSRSLFDYTVLGDEVNLCSRLEKLNKMYKTRILISQATFDGLPDAFVTRKIGDLQVRGRCSPVCVYELVAESPDDLDAPQAVFLYDYHRAWTHFERGEWDKALLFFERALDSQPGDAAARIALEQCRRHIREADQQDVEIASTDEVI